MSDNLARTPLYEWHVAHGGRMVDFADWSMPVQYTSIVEEHTACRSAATLFDVSHMGRFRFDGPGAAAFLDRLLTRRVLGMAPGKIRYALVTNESGGILDDVLVYHLAETDGRPFHLLVVNAGNRAKIAAWIKSHLSPADNVSFSDRTLETAMIAVQGPKALQISQQVVNGNLAALDYYTGIVARIGNTEGIASRTGYTGEDGCELIVPADAAHAVWTKLFSLGQAAGITAAGLGARDTLRLEAAMPLYGHELSEEINPLDAGLDFAVNLKDREFIGKSALAKFKNGPPRRKRVGLEPTGKRVPREHYPVLSGTEQVGEVTSGTFSPTLQRPIAMAYVRPEFAVVGSELSVDIRGTAMPARVVKLPFYTRPSA
jgi:aminomethyltransferase